MGEEGSTGSTSRSRSFQPEEEEEAFGHMNDLPLTFCSTTSFRAVGLREILQSSVEVLGESGLGISEKVVLWDGMFFVAKRFRRVLVRKGEFGRRVERLALVSAGCESLVPLRAYLYAKRTKLVLFQYYPMGSLAVLLSGVSLSLSLWSLLYFTPSWLIHQLGHEWNRINILCCEPVSAGCSRNFSVPGEHEKCLWGPFDPPVDEMELSIEFSIVHVQTQGLQMNS